MATVLSSALGQIVWKALYKNKLDWKWMDRCTRFGCPVLSVQSCTRLPPVNCLQHPEDLYEAHGTLSLPLLPRSALGDVSIEESGKRLLISSGSSGPVCWDLQRLWRGTIRAKLMGRRRGRRSEAASGCYYNNVLSAVYASAFLCFVSNRAAS